MDKGKKAITSAPLAVITSLPSAEAASALPNQSPLHRSPPASTSATSPPKDTVRFAIVQNPDHPDLSGTLRHQDQREDRIEDDELQGNRRDFPGEPQRPNGYKRKLMTAWDDDAQ
jgi:hypothetical protein